MLLHAFTTLFYVEKMFTNFHPQPPPPPFNLAVRSSAPRAMLEVGKYEMLYMYWENLV